MKTAGVSWLATLGIGLTTLIVGAVVGGWLANKAVSWYQISSREGGSGYFVLFQGIIFTGIVSLILGVVVSRVVSNNADATFVRAFAFAHITVLLLLGAVGVLARLLAHVPPTIGGEQLMLAVEFSWPEASTPAWVGDSTKGNLVLFSSVGKGPYYGKSGPLWTDKVRHEAGRVVVPGFVEIYTSRGKRLMGVKDSTDGGEPIVVPLRGYPRGSDLKWSEWLPTTSTGPVSGATYRFRAVKRSEPIRFDTVGAFTIGTAVEAFNVITYENQVAVLNAKSSFDVRYNNTPINRQVVRSASSDRALPADQQTFTSVNAVAAIKGQPSALVLQVDQTYGLGRYCLLRANDGKPVCEQMSVGSYRMLAHEMKPVAREGDSISTKTIETLSGTFAANRLSNDALYVFPECVLDARTLAIYPIERETYSSDLDLVAPVGLSPDAKKFARIMGDIGKPVLAVVTIATNARRDVAIQTTPSTTGNWTDVDRAWFDNYFVWEKSAAGEYDLALSPLAKELPHRGRLKQEPGYRQYDLATVDSAMRVVVVDFLVKEFGAARLPAKPDDYTHKVSTKDGTMYVGYTEGQVNVFMDRGTNTLPVATFARKFDEALATRRFDSHFMKPKPE